MRSTISRQSWALVRRYKIHFLRRPFINILHGVLWPLVLIGLAAFLVYDIPTDNYRNFLIDKIGPYISLITVLLFFHFSQYLVGDRATRNKSLMLSMGLKRSSYYLANSICFLAFAVPTVMTICALSLSCIITDSQAPTAAIILVFILFNIHFTGLLFTVTSFITSSSLAGLVIWFYLLESQLHTVIIWIMERTGVTLRPLVLFFGSMSPFESIRILCSSYQLCKNCDSTNLSDGLVSQPTYLILMAMTFWTVVAFAFARWFDEVCPWQKDSAVRSPFFCFKSKQKPFLNIERNEYSQNSRYFEQTVANREIGIQINDITKIFKNKPVVNGITFNIYKGETTLLLGHNGAGKTTLMDMVIGKQESDIGTVTLMDSSVQLSENGVGFCPQTSILDDNLTVRQHLELFADIKPSKIAASEMKNHVEITINDVGLTDHMNKLPTELSGGMKRKLSLAMAFVGDSGILILDEPGSGLDPDSRIFIWNAIRRYREDRTVLLSTQHMDEADFLGDRIAIMSEGKIICCGSSTYLNKIFGNGYKLRIRCHASEKELVLVFVRKYFESAKLSDDTQSIGLMKGVEDPIQDFIIELVDNNSKDLEINLIRMLEEIENNPGAAHIKSFGLRSSSIEDVLLNTSKLSQEWSNEPTKETVRLNLASTDAYIATLFRGSPREMDTGSQWLFLRALLFKHIHIYKKDWASILINRILVPAVAICWMIRGLAKHTKQDALLYTPTYYPSLLVLHYVYNPVLERATKFKTMQLTSRASFAVYWLAQVMMDSLSFIALAIYINLFLALTFDGEILESTLVVHTVATTAIFMMALSAAIIAYILSLILNDTKTCIGYYQILNLTSCFLTVLVLIVGFGASSKMVWLRNIINAICVIICPLDSFQYIFFGLEAECYVAPAYSNDCIKIRTFSPIYYGFIALAGQIVVYGWLLYKIEKLNLNLSWYLKWKNLYSPKYNSFTGAMHVIDEDVMLESSKATRLIDSVIPRDAYSMVASNLSKSYVADERVVDQLSFTVNRGECFGLLGVNGAGKSTTFSMLVDEIRPDIGRIWANGHFNDDDAALYRPSIGYDPQPNPEMSLSPIDALSLMARLRCVHERKIPEMVDAIIELLEMTEHAKKPTKILSGGTKRKLALGMSLIGNPALLALDEPTAGVDPIARRSIWQLLRSLRGQNEVSIVISSHAMEECEAICDRISIMARGRLRCVGTFMSLRSRFSQGCRIRVQFGGQLIEQNGIDGMKKLICTISERLQAELGSSVRLTDTNATSATYNVSDDNVERSKIFRMLRELRQTHPGMCYMVDDSSLEDIFIALAREQQKHGQTNSFKMG